MLATNVPPPHSPPYPALLNPSTCFPSGRFTHLLYRWLYPALPTSLSHRRCFTNRFTALPDRFTALLNCFTALPNCFTALPNRFTALPNRFTALPALPLYQTALPLYQTALMLYPALPIS